MSVDTIRYQHPKPPAQPALRYGPLELPSRYLLSPLAGFTNLEFRLIVRELGGVGLGTTDLVNARGLMHGNAGTRQMIESCPEDRPFSVQIFGSEPDIMCQAAEFLESRGVDAIDINMGCPVHRITKGGAGSAMMCRQEETVQMVRQIVESVPVPVTVKMRLGWDDSQLTSPEFAAAFESVGVAAVMIHGRTREQGFSGNVNLDGIRKTVEAVKGIPVIGNGDIRSIPDADRMFRETGCHGVSIGRGALANPWIFRQLVEWEQTGEYGPAGSFLERLDLLRKQFSYLERRFATEDAIVRFRKMGHWYLKGMRVRKRLRGEFQQAKTREEFEAALQAIEAEGPVQGTKDGILPDPHIPVPSGPVERW
jgi:nifR3 family TIM-barrel protein